MRIKLGKKALYIESLWLKSEAREYEVGSYGDGFWFQIGRWLFEISLLENISDEDFEKKIEQFLDNREGENISE